MPIEDNALMPRAELLLNMLTEPNKELTIEGIGEFKALFAKRCEETGALNTPSNFMLFMAGTSDGARLICEEVLEETMPDEEWQKIAWASDKITAFAIIVHDAKGETP